MAKISENMIPDINADWGLDASNNLPYSGEAVQEFIKRTLKQKYGYFHYDEIGNRYMVFADKDSYDLYNQDIFTRYSIKRQFAERIDMYFDMYGYQTNKVKLPNITGRPNWNYVKTHGLNALQKSTANIPQEDFLEFKNLFNNGTTLWHNPATFLDYSQNNR